MKCKRKTKFSAFLPKLAQTWAASGTYARRSYDYGKLLLQMSETGSYVLGSDGAPNWPDPPVPGEKGIVSKATEHLVPPRPQWTGGSVHGGWML